MHRALASRVKSTARSELSLDLNDALSNNMASIGSIILFTLFVGGFDVSTTYGVGEFVYDFGKNLSLIAMISLVAVPTILRINSISVLGILAGSFPSILFLDVCGRVIKFTAIYTTPNRVTPNTYADTLVGQLNTLLSTNSITEPLFFFAVGTALAIVFVWTFDRLGSDARGLDD